MGILVGGKTTPLKNMSWDYYSEISANPHVVPVKKTTKTHAISTSWFSYRRILTDHFTRQNMWCIHRLSSCNRGFPNTPKPVV
jgi:hypothetical protein